MGWDQTAAGMGWDRYTHWYASVKVTDHFSCFSFFLEEAEQYGSN
jgi:hypothetical protein